jgi:hypothetical protein
MENGIFIKFLVSGFYGEFVITISELSYLYFEVWVGCEGWLICRRGSQDA